VLQTSVALQHKVNGVSEYMNGTENTNATTRSDEEGGLDPQEAARLLKQTRRDAQRKFETTRPLLSVLMAAVILIGYGTIWLSVLGQHPYTGPSLLALAVVYTAVVVVVVVYTTVRKLATTGVSGRSQRQQRAEIATIVTAYVATAVFQGALKYDGASLAIVYGVFPATAPLLVVGSAAAGMAGVREDWPMFGTALFVVIVATGSAFAGPVWAWAVTGVGLFLAVSGHAVATAWLRRA
jgi:hypothetical protein